MRGPASTVLRWTLGTAAGGVLVGVVEVLGGRFAATLLLPGLAMGAGQRLAVPGRVPPVWTVFSGLAWVAGALLDATLGVRPAGLGAWWIPTAVMALWQLFLLNEPRRAWPWLPISLVAAVALQLGAQGACALGCAPLAQGLGPAWATGLSYGAGFAAYGLVTGLALLVLARPAPAEPVRTEPPAG